MTPSAIEPATFTCVMQCLNQLRHLVPQNYDVHPTGKFSLAGTNCRTQEVGNYKVNDHQTQTERRLGQASWTLWNRPPSSVLNSLWTQRNSSEPAVVFHIWQTHLNSESPKDDQLHGAKTNQSIHQYLAGSSSPLYLAKHTAKSVATSSKTARDIIQYIGVDINYTEI